MLQDLQMPGDNEIEQDQIESSEEAIEDDGTPVLDEEDLEENDLSDNEAEEILWDEPKKGSART